MCPDQVILVFRYQKLNEREGREGNKDLLLFILVLIIALIEKVFYYS